LAAAGVVVTALAACTYAVERASQPAPPTAAPSTDSPPSQAPPAAVQPVATSANLAPGQGPAPVHSYEVLQRYPHDPDAFTQGLQYVDGILYEGTGIYGESTLRKVDLESGEVLQSVALENRYFGEGITVFDDRII
jgi:hypothetical protein